MTLPDNYVLERREVKHARIRVSENLSVRVLVPKSFSNNDIHLLLRKKQKWIDKNLAAFSNKKDSIRHHYNQLLLFGNRYNYYFTSVIRNKVEINHQTKTIQSKTNLLDSFEQKKWYRRFAKQYIAERVILLAKNHKFHYNKVFIRDQRTKWGNCSKERNLSFNWRLIKAPPFVIDYLIIHELLHTRIMNHHKRFWSELRMFLPGYHEAVKWLDKYGNSL